MPLTSLKLSFNGEIRRLSVASDGLTYPDLVDKTLSLFPRLTSIQFSWVDDEGDKVVISSNEELSEALRVMTSEKKGYLRFEVLAATSAEKETASQSTPSRSEDKSTGTNTAAAKGSAPAATTTAPTAMFGTITHAGVMCDGCGSSPLAGSRFKCSVREDYDLCECCELSGQQPYPMVKIYRPDQVPAGIMVIVDEGRGKKHGGPAGALCHRGIVCDGCNIRNFHGPRFKCSVRQDFDLCEACEAKDSHDHVMVKIYPQHARMHIQVVPKSKTFVDATVPPHAAAQLRENLFGLGLGCRRGYHGPAGHRGPPGHHGPPHHGPGHHGPPHHGPGHHHVPPPPGHHGPPGHHHGPDGHHGPPPPPAHHHHGPHFEDPGVPDRRRGWSGGGPWRKGPRRRDHFDRSAVAQAAADRAVQHASALEEQKRLHKAKEDARLEEELLDMCIKLSMKEKLAAAAAVSAAASSQKSEPHREKETTNEEKSGENEKAVNNLPAPPVKLMARFVRDVTMPDGSEIAPYSTFFKTWRVRNDGKSDWPEGCHLVSAGGDRLVDSKLGDDFVLRHPVPATAAGDEVDLTLELCAPSSTGRHVGYFRLENPDGGYFGQRLWADIRVTEADMSVSMTLSPWQVVGGEDEDEEVDEQDEDEKEGAEHSNVAIGQVEHNITVTDPLPTQPQTVLTNEDERDRLLDDTPVLLPPTPVETRESELDAELALWRKELQVLSAMGFHDLEQLLPVLKAHVKVPASQQDEGEEDAPGSEAGLQAAVLALLSGHE